MEIWFSIEWLTGVVIKGLLIKKMRSRLGIYSQILKALLCRYLRLQLKLFIKFSCMVNSSCSY